MSRRTTSSPASEPQSGSGRRRAEPAGRRGSSVTSVSLRVGAVVAIFATWVALTSTTDADPAGARPGVNVSVKPAPESLPRQAPARQLSLLLNSTTHLGANDPVRVALLQGKKHLGLSLPKHDAEEDAERATDLDAEQAAKDSLRLAKSMTTAGLKATPGQAKRLLFTAANLDAAARTTLGEGAPGATAAGVGQVLAAQGANAPLTDALKPTLTASDCRVDTTQAPAKTRRVAGFAEDEVAGAQASAARTQLVHDAGQQAGVLAYATRVAGQRTGSKPLLERATDLDSTVDQLQAALPSSCTPIATTTAGSLTKLTSPDSLNQANRALADRLLNATAAVPAGPARQALARTWWKQYSLTH